MRYRPLILKLLSAGIVFGAWEIAGRVPVSFAFPTFVESMAAFWTLLVDGTMFDAYAETLKPLVVGVLISALLGIAIGLAMGLSRGVDWLVSPIFIVMQTAPLAALIPLLVMVYAIGLTSKVFVVCIMAMPVVVINTAGAVGNAPASLIEMGQSFLGTRAEIILKIILPAAAPVIFARLRLGVSAGFIGAILSELKITPTGVGDIITYSRSIAASMEISHVMGSQSGELVNAVEARNVYKNYGDVEALQDPSLDFPRGQLTSLLGPPGCGKTTLLKIIAGSLPATSGEVTVNGQPVTGPGPDRAFVFQDFALLPWATVLRNVAFGLELRGVARSEREAIAETYIGNVGLKGFELNCPHELSGGMRQRVGLARALSVDAEVLLMDEPFSAVDEQTRRKFQEDLLDFVQGENKTFIFVTHSIEEAVYVSDQMAILLPRPSRVSEVIRPEAFRHRGADNIRRDPEYLDIVDRIWASLRTYVE